MSDIDTEAMDCLKALDPNRPIREADMCSATRHVRFVPIADIAIAPGDSLFYLRKRILTPTVGMSASCGFRFSVHETFLIVLPVLAAERRLRCRHLIPFTRYGLNLRPSA